MQHLDVSGAVRHIYIYIYVYVIRRLKINDKEIPPPLFPPTTYNFSNFHWLHLHSSSVGHNWYS